MRTDVLLIIAGLAMFATSCFAADHPNAAKYSKADRDAMTRAVTWHAYGATTYTGPDKKSVAKKQVPDVIMQVWNAGIEAEIARRANVSTVNKTK